MPKYKVPNFGSQGRPEALNTASVVTTGTAPVSGGANGSGGLAHQGDLGVVYEENTKRWQIFEIVDAANGAIGDLLYVKNYAAYTATPTIGNSGQSEVAGVAELVFTTPVASTTRVFGALRIGGVMSVKSADATINARGLQVTSAAAANQVILQAGIIKSIGVSQAAQAAGFVSVFLTIQPI